MMFTAHSCPSSSWVQIRLLLPLWLCWMMLMLVCHMTAAEAQPAMTVFTVDGLTRVRPYDPPQSTASVTIKAARNEYEPFQLVVRAGSNGLSRVNVEISDLRGEGGHVISQQSLTLYREHYVSVTNPSPKSKEGAGQYPDALIPFLNPIDGMAVTNARFVAVPFNVPPNANQPIWVDVFVPKDTLAGNYSGMLTISAQGQSAVTVPVQLVVWNFALPDTPSMRSSFGGLGSRLAKNLKINQDSAEFLVIERRYAEAMAAHRLCPPIPGGVMPLVQSDGSIDPKKTHAKLKEWMQSLRVTGISLKNLGTNSASTRYLQSMYTYLKTNGWENLAYIYVLDEPNDAAAYEFVRQRAKFIHEAQPGIRILCTEQPTPQDPAWGSLVGSVDIWVVRRTLLEENAGPERLAAGEELWSYTAICQGYDSPYWQIDFPLLNYRIPAWINWRYGMTGMLYWSTVYWEQAGDIWANPLNYNRLYNGEASLFYPGTDAGFAGPVVSMRMKQIREGMEDYEYFALLAKLGEKAFADESVNRIAESWKQWDDNPAHLYDLREQLAQRLSGRGPLKPTELKPTN